jgi:hypothetical protein
VANSFGIFPYARIHCRSTTGIAYRVDAYQQSEEEIAKSKSNGISKLLQQGTFGPTASERSRLLTLLAANDDNLEAVAKSWVSTTDYILAKPKMMSIH